MEEGTVLELLSKMCLVEKDGELLRCAYRGKLFEKKGAVRSPVVPGDRILFNRTADGEGVVESVLERKNKLSRPASYYRHIEQVMVANVDLIVIVSSTRNPPFRSGLIDRILVASNREELNTLICLNKIDLVAGEEYRNLLEPFRDLGYTVFFSSTVTGEGIPDLKDAIVGKTSVLVGHSGVGKSSIINVFNPELNLRTGEVSRVKGRGKHVTASARLHPIAEGTFVVDTPGVREFGLWDITREDLDLHFPGISSFGETCRFGQCTHTHEPGCAIKKALKEGRIRQDRYDAYVRILESFKEKGGSWKR